VLPLEASAAAAATPNDNGDIDPQIGRPVQGARSVIRVIDLFTYATGQFSLRGLVPKAYGMGLTHPRSGRRIVKTEVHRILTNPIYVGEFRWAGRLFHGCHEALVTRATFEDVQAVLTRKPRGRYPKQRHAFMGLLTCARCGCSITAERKKGRYTYYRCTGFHGACGNTYVREERLSKLLAGTVQAI
jgi:hypothetical protein